MQTAAAAVPETSRVGRLPTQASAAPTTAKPLVVPRLLQGCVLIVAKQLEPDADAEEAEADLVALEHRTAVLRQLKISSPVRRVRHCKARPAPLTSS